MVNQIIGSNGATGPTGPTGKNGPAGPMGYIGLRGDTGPTGPTGKNGPVGPIGYIGLIGNTGPTGPTGKNGPIGPEGEIGPRGPTGLTGPTGKIGPDGPAGPVLGYIGPTGPTGTFGTLTDSKSAGGGKNSLWYDVGTETVYYDSTKSFVIPHPIEPESKYLVHACLEGPEAGVYYRGIGEIINGTNTTISLPDYASVMAKSFTIQLTPIYNNPSDVGLVLVASKVKDGSFSVYGPNCEFYWIVYGERTQIVVEPKVSDVVVRGNGPYLYIEKN